MTPTTRKLALRAAAKVTLAGALFGCENTPAQNAEPSRAQSPPPANVNTAAAEPPPAAPVAASTQCGTDPTNKTDVSCCMAAVAATTADGGAVTTTNDTECCKTLVAWGSGAGWFEGHDECCRAIHYPHSTSCTPWGPPVPPAMYDWA